MRDNEFDWAEQSVAWLRILWAEGHSTAAIARTMGTTKNSVVGKAHRLKLEARPSPIRDMPLRPKPPKAAGKATLAPIVLAAKPVMVAPAPMPMPMPEPKPVIPFKRVPCCWPEGDPKEPGFRFCGEPRAAKRDGTLRSYCAAHAERAYLRVGVVGW